MPRRTHRALIRNLLGSLIAIDLAALSGLVANQWFMDGLGPSLGLSLALLFPLFAVGRPLADAVLAMAERHSGVPNAGEQIPSTGQSFPTSLSRDTSFRALRFPASRGISP